MGEGDNVRDAEGVGNLDVVPQPIGPVEKPFVKPYNQGLITYPHLNRNLYLFSLRLRAVLGLITFRISNMSSPNLADS